MGKAVKIRHCAATVMCCAPSGRGAQPEDQPVGKLESGWRCTGFSSSDMKIPTTAPHGGVARVVPALALAGCFSFAQAELSAPLPEVELAPVTVSALGGLAVPYDQTGVSVTVLDLPELRKEGVYTLSDALTTVPGVFVLPGGGLNQRGNASNIVIRGMRRGNMTLPMMDGMRLYSYTNSMNLTANVLARANIFNLGKVEVLRGSQGATCGAGAVGGVIFMETPEGQGEPGFTLFNEAGSFDSYTGNAVAQGREGKLAWYLSATYERTNNDLAFDDGRPLAVRHAGHSEAWYEALRLDYDLNPDNRLTFTWRREDAAYRYVGVFGSSDYDFRSQLLTAKWQTRLSERWTSLLMAGYAGYDSTFGQGLYYDQRNVQVEWRNAWCWNERHTTTAGFAWNRELFDDEGAAPTWPAASEDALNNVYSLFAEHCYSPAANWDNSLALRWDRSSIYDNFLTLRAATSYGFNHGRSRAFASLGNGYLAPGALQRGGEYQSNGTLFCGNRNLNCSTSLSADMGLEHELALGLLARVSLFWLREEDGIMPDTSNPAYTTWKNDSAHWTSQGVELSLEGTWEKRWNTGYRLEWSYVQPKDSQDRQLVETARQQWSADIHTSPWEGVTTGIGLTAAVGRNDWSGYRVDDYCILRWYAHYRHSEQLSFHLRVENLTNERFIADSMGNGQPGSLLNSGAAVYGGCTLTF